MLELRDLVDDILEEGLLERKNLGEVMATALPRICELIGASGAFVQSYGEDLTMHVFRHPGGLVVPGWEAMVERTSDDRREDFCLQDGGEMLVAQHLDVAGEWFGRAGLLAPAGDDPGAQRERLRSLLHIACEELDNFLFSIKAAREKHRVMMELAGALRHQVLGEGLELAVGALSRATPLDRLLLVFVAQESASSTLHVQVFEGGKLRVDTMRDVGVEGPEHEAALRAEGRAFLRGEGAALVERFGFVGAQEEGLISGVTRAVTIGKVMATSRSGAFNVYDRELLAGFCGFIQQRVVDFNKEWRRLAASFRPHDVARMLQAEDYEARFLTPREGLVAIAYADIAGFTRISEQILGTPSAVARLVEAWSADAVRLIWEHGGVFDKMVGDCIIALFGPPFYEQSPGERLASALRWSIDIQQMTRAFPAREGFEVLRAEGLALTVGVHLAPLFVGTFGPNQNFTGFSSGMNNTARLQGIARRGEILVMQEAIEQLPPGHPFSFGEERSAQAKNVAQPLRFRALDQG